MSTNDNSNGSEDVADAAPHADETRSRVDTVASFSYNWPALEAALDRPAAVARLQAKTAQDRTQPVKWVGFADADPLGDIQAIEDSRDSVTGALPGADFSALHEALLDAIATSIQAPAGVLIGVSPLSAARSFWSRILELD